MALELKAVLFDCDGTLVDSELLGNVALSRQLALAGLQVSGEALTQRFRGHRLLDMLATLQAEHGVDLPAGFVELYRARAADLFEREVVPMPGAAALLDALAARGVPTCITSNGPLAKIAQTLRVAGLAPHFGDRLFSAYEVGSWKPDPALFLHAAAALGVRPRDCIVVDDSLAGIEAAGRAGMRALWLRAPGAEPGAAAPHAIIVSSLAEVGRLLVG